MNLLVIEAQELSSNGRIRVADHRARHLLDTLRVEVGREIRMGLLDGPVGVGRVCQISSGEVELVFEPTEPAPPRPAMDLLLALPRPKVMKRLWAQLASMGVGRIILANAARVERNYFDTHVLAESFYRPLLIEGLQQARDTRLPRVSIHRQFRKLVESELDGLSDATERFVAHPVGLRENFPPARGRRLLAVGPEGGWNDFEIELLRARGFQPVSMGARTLRSDTACIALLALASPRV